MEGTENKVADVSSLAFRRQKFFPEEAGNRQTGNLIPEYHELVLEFKELMFLIRFVLC